MSLRSAVSDGPPYLIVLAFAAVIATRLIARSFDRQRIREHLERSGAKVLDITANSTWGWRKTRDRAYDVTYRTPQGRTITAPCRTSMFSGVYWTSDAPPSGFAEIQETPAEPIACLACGAKIPARQRHCPKCGWGYTGK